MEKRNPEVCDATQTSALERFLGTAMELQLPGVLGFLGAGMITEPTTTTENDRSFNLNRRTSERADGRPDSNERPCPK
ncbi:hypothetical protein QR680_007138 [Steinernema hermaphroditum]|uniref:Uncharacterized protein n=1 Tax=Steinernema hermaphroditum TaxID=289476 RepID=A0AA39HXV4_9BILA|nr:hypothetical protein QR680_007138 [Steinernema hermaphroditum]